MQFGEVYQAVKCAFWNLQNLVLREIEYDQIFAFIETFDFYNFIRVQPKFCDKNRGFFQPLDLFNIRTVKPDFTRLANASFLIQHLNAVG